MRERGSFWAVCLLGTLTDRMNYINKIQYRNCLDVKYTADINY